MLCGAVLGLSVACGAEAPVEPAGPRADGQLGPWSSAPPMPIARAVHCSVVLGEDLLVIGGTRKPAGATDFVSTDLVHAARIESDGTLGPWREAGHTPSPVDSCAAAADGERLYLVGGRFTDDAHRGQAWTATRKLDGTLSGFVSLGPLPANHLAISSGAWVHQGWLYVSDSELPDSGDRTVTLRAPIEGDSLGAWTVDAGVTGFLGLASYALARGNVFTVGGYLGPSGKNAVVADAWSAPIGPDGAVGEAVPVAPLPVPRAFGALVGVDEYLFFIGGKTMLLSGMGQPEVFAAHVEDDGGVLAWSAVEPLPEGRTSLRAAAGPTHLYVSGGGAGGGGLPDVFAAQVRHSTNNEGGQQ